MLAQESSARKPEVIFRQPVAEDGMALNRLIASCPPLDPNSVYCNILQCSHFADTAILAEFAGGEASGLAGFISGYRRPGEPETYFLWQVAVAAQARGIGLGKRMMSYLLSRLADQGVVFLETTITPGNEASWALFRGFARELGVPCEDTVWLDRDRHFQGAHDSEHLLRIGPFTPDNFQYS